MLFKSSNQRVCNPLEKERKKRHCPHCMHVPFILTSTIGLWVGLWIGLWVGLWVGLWAVSAVNMCKDSVDDLQRAWRHEKITTRDYLLAINRMGGRSMNNIMRYPIFPWILSMDPVIESMSFDNDAMFRDLKKPIIFQNVDMVQYTRTIDHIPSPCDVERVASMLCCSSMFPLSLNTNTHTLSLLACVCNGF